MLKKVAICVALLISLSVPVAARLRVPASTLESKIRALKIDKFKFRS